jgi:hypothetical protein
VESRTQVPVVFIDDLPSVSISPLRATRAVLPTDQFAWVHVEGEDFKLHLHQRELMHGVRFTISCVRLGAGEKRENFGSLEPGQVACCRCCKAAGIRYRIEHMSPSRRAEYRAPRLRAMLSSPTPLMKNRRNHQRMERRAALEAALIQCELKASMRTC